MGSKHKTLADLFHHQVKDLFDAERHAGKTLSRMAKATETEALRTAMERRHEDVAVRVERLEAVFDAMDKKAHGLPCEAMQGLVAETKALVEEFADGPALDAGLIAAAQAIEHYAIARYAALRLWAGRLGLEAALVPLEANMAQSRRDLDRWTILAETWPDAAAVGAAPMTLKEAALRGLG